MKFPEDQKTAFTIQAVHRMTGISTPTLRKMGDRGQLEVNKVGRLWMVPRRELVRLGALDK